MDTYHWDVLVKYHWDVVGCFIWDLLEMSWRRTDETSSLRPLETWSRHTNKMSWRRTTETSWRRSTETSLGVSFETYLLHCWDVQRDVVTTSPRRLVVGWVIWGSYCFNLEMKSNNKCSNYDTNEEMFNGKFAVKPPPLLLINTVRSSFDPSLKSLKLQLVYHYYSISVNILQVIMVVRPKYPLKFWLEI